MSRNPARGLRRESATKAPASFGTWIASSVCWPWRRCAAKPSDEGGDRPEDKTALARIGPDCAQRDAQSAAGAHACDIPDEITVACAGVGPGEVEPPQARVDRTAPRAGEDVDARAGGLEQERVGEAGAAGLGLVPLGALGFEPADKLVMAVGRRLGRSQRVAAGVGRTHRAAAHSRRRLAPDRAQNRRRWPARPAPRRRRRRPHARPRPAQARRPIRRASPPSQRAAPARRTSPRRQDRRLRPGTASEPGRTRRVAPAAEQSARPRAGRRPRRRRTGRSARPVVRSARRGGFNDRRIGRDGRRERRRFRRGALADQADSGCFADFRHAYLLNRSALRTWPPAAPPSSTTARVTDAKPPASQVPSGRFAL